MGHKLLRAVTGDTALVGPRGKNPSDSHAWLVLPTGAFLRLLP